MTHSHTPDVRLGLAFAAVVALAFPLGIALAGGTKPTPKPAGPAAKPAAGAPAAGGQSLADVEKASLEKRYEAVVAYSKANPKAADAEEACKRVVDLAEELENWAKVVEHSDEFLAGFPSSKDKVEVSISKAGALVRLEKAPEAKAIYEALTKAFGKDDNPAQMWSVWQAYAGLLTDMDDVTGAKKAYEDAKAAIPHPQVAQLADAAIKNLDLIGSDPTAFPDTAKDMDGKALKLEDYKGKVLMIDFWATWCGPCRAEMPNVVAAYKKWHDKGFEILGITLDEKDKVSAVKDFQAKNGMVWPQFYDGNGWGNEIAQLYEVHSIPHTILIGKDGKIVKLDVRGPAIDKALARLLK